MVNLCRVIRYLVKSYENGIADEQRIRRNINKCGRYKNDSICPFKAWIWYY